MKHKTWFRLILKAIGIFMLAQSLPTLISTGSNILYTIIQSNSTTNSPFVTSIYGDSPLEIVLSYLFQFGTIDTILTIILGLYLLFGGKLLVNLCIPSNRPYCPHCGYELRVLPKSICSECGTKLPEEFAAPPKLSEESETATAPETLWQRMVPAENQPAQIGYYLTIASLIPMFGVLTAPAACIFGFMGLRWSNKRPAIGGRCHAWFAIILGGLLIVIQFVGGCWLMFWAIDL